MQGPEPAKGEADRFLANGDATKIELRINHEQGYPNADEHTNDAPNHSGVGKISDDPVVVREFF
jgi:hypothetical protein